jgi:hypothetical protein
MVKVAQKCGTARKSGGRLLAVESQRQRRSGKTDLSGLPSARLLVAVAVCVLGLESGPALAQGSRPEPAPVRAPAKLGPEPAPAARAAPPPTTVSRSAPASSASQRSSATTSRPSVAVTSAATAPAQPRSSATSRTKPNPPRSVPANPKSTNAVKSFADAIPRSATRVAVGAVPAGSGDSNRLLFLGGLALLLLVLSDAALLGFSARALREAADDR